MIEKKEKIIITFFTTNDALQLEDVCMQKKIQGRLIPVPKKISASCGMAFCTDIHLESEILNTIQEDNIRIEAIHYEWI